MSWTSTNTAQSQTATGNLGDVSLHQRALTSVEQFWVGGGAKAESDVLAEQTEHAWNSTGAAQQQTTSSGAAIIYPWNLFPAQVTAQSMGNTAQAQTITGLMPMQDQTSMLHQHGRVDIAGYNVDSNLQQTNSATGTGTLNQQQANAGAGQVNAFAVPPFPTQNTILIPGGVVGRIFQNITNFVQFGPF